MNQAVSGADAVLEVELNARELLALRGLRGSGRMRLFPRIVAGVGAAACFAMLVAMLVSHRTGEQSTPAWITKMGATLPAIADAVLPSSVSAPAAAAVATATVKFANPFDRTEMFEFPAGTSADEAQARVAEILLQRAQDRRR